MFKRMLWITGTVALAIAVGLAGVWLYGQATGPAEAQTSKVDSDYSPAQTITVVGQGSVSVKPDVAQVSVGVETSAETISDAVAENEDKMTSILSALREAGIAEKDIQTMNYSISLDRYPEPMPRGDAESGEPQPVYRVSNMVNVTIRELDAVGDVLDAVIEAGANNVWGISFALDDQTAAQSDARANAIAEAKAHAEELAELNAVTLGPVMSVSEVIGASPMPVAFAVERAAAGGGPVSPGELEISYQVQVSYFIKQ